VFDNSKLGQSFPPFTIEVTRGNIRALVDGKSRQGGDGSSMDILTVEIRSTTQDVQPALNARQVIVTRG
jgi:hypothetical protein